MTTTRTIPSPSTASRCRRRSRRTTSWSRCCAIPFSLFGARESCGQGLCGCCTVIVDGRAVSGCLYLAAFADGTRGRDDRNRSTRDGALDPVQEAFIEDGAFQCGFCTPGFVLMVKQLLDEYPDPDDDRIRHYLAGNLCRCAAYPEIIEAVKAAARKRKAARAA